MKQEHVATAAHEDERRGLNGEYPFEASLVVLVWFPWRSRRDGEVVFAFLAGAGGVRIPLDLVRYTEETATLTRDVLTVTVSQGVGLLLLAAAAVGVVAVGRR